MEYVGFKKFTFKEKSFFFLSYFSVKFMLIEEVLF